MTFKTLLRCSVCRWTVGCVGGFLLMAVPLRADIAREYQIKAAFLYNFTKFVEWPVRHVIAADRPIVIGLLDRNPFGDELEHIVRGRNVDGHPLAIRLVQTADEAATVDLLFIPAGEEDRFDSGMQARLRQSGVLTVGESDRFLAANGMINFVIEGDKVRFAINLKSAGQSGLKISAQLLKLATAIFGNS